MDLAKHDASFEASFAPEEEAALVSLILDFPEFFANLSDHITPDLFAVPEVKFVMAFILNAYDKFNVVPTRELMSATIKKQLKVDDNYEGIVKLLNRPSDPREVPLLKDSLMSWAERRTYGMLYQEEVMASVQNGNYAPVKEIVDKAGRISDVATSGFWLFKHFETLFQEQCLTHIKTGFPALDAYLNDGGPSPGEVLVWMAATGVGKCHTLDSNIIEENLSRIFELELEDGTIRQLAGFRIVQTARGSVRVCDLAESDDIESLPVEDDLSDNELSAL